jgi:hypothetical protein
MFPYADPSSALTLHHQKVDQLIREAADRRLAREASGGRRRRFGRWRGKAQPDRGAAVPAAA